MKIYKKFFTVTVLIIIILIAGCSDGEELFELEFNTENNELDFEGVSFAFGSHWINEYVLETGASDSGDKMNARYKAIEEKFNIEFKLLSTNYCSESAIITHIASSLIEFVPDFMDISGDQAFRMYQLDMLYPFDEINTIDITDEKYGSNNFVTNGAEWDGHRWCIYPNNWQLIPQYVGSLIFDNDLLKKYGLDKKPYELMENGSWTWENFSEILREMTFTEGENQYTALSYENSAWLCKTAILSNGGKMVDVSGNVASFAMNSPEAYEALDWLSELYSSGVMYTGTGIGKLRDGLTAFEYSQSYNATLQNSDSNYAFSLPDYGVISFPWGPQAEYGTTCSAFVYANRRFICCVDVSQNDKDQLGYILDFMFDPLDGDEKTQWKNSLRYILHHEEDIENFIWMYENLNYDYSLELSGISSQINSALDRILKGQDSPSTALNALNEAAKTSIDEYWIK